MKPFNEFKVVSRQFILGRGNITVISNKDEIPIDTKCVVIQEDKMLPIIGVEMLMTLMTEPRPKPNWGIVTNEETVGDTLMIWNKGIEPSPEKNNDQSHGKNSDNLVIRL